MSGATPDTPPLRRLPGRGWKVGLATSKRQRLYLAPDHLLVVNSYGYEEKSKRFAFADIQAITIQTNKRRAYQVFFSVFASIVLVALAASVAVHLPNGASGFVLVLLVFPVSALIFDLIAGPTSTVRLHTAVQAEDLDALRRLRSAQKAIDILLPYIRAAQGGGSEDLLSAAATDREGEGRLAVTGGSGVETVPRATPRPTPAAAQAAVPKRVIGPGVHGWAFALTGLYGVSGLLATVFAHPAKTVLDAALMMGAVVLLIVAAIRQTHSTLPTDTQRYTWITLIVASAVVVAVTYINMIAQMTIAVETGEPPPVFGSRSLHPTDYPGWFRWVLGGAGLINLTLGLFGLISLRGYRVVVSGPESGGERMES